MPGRIPLLFVPNCNRRKKSFVFFVLQRCVGSFFSEGCGRQQQDQETIVFSPSFELEALAEHGGRRNLAFFLSSWMGSQISARKCMCFGVPAWREKCLFPQGALQSRCLVLSLSMSDFANSERKLTISHHPSPISSEQSPTHATRRTGASHPRNSP